jgi:hypothetical protein
MTPKQQERLINKIKKVKAALAADKKRWGGFYDDSSGLRYIPPQLYIQLNDFSGGLRYFNWFNKNFPDDSGFPDFLFEWIIVLYKTGKLNEAEKKAFETFCSNTYLFDVFFNRPITKMEKWEGSNLASEDFAVNYFSYSNKQENLSDFSHWLDEFLATEKFIQVKSKFLHLRQQLKTEKITEKRRVLIEQEKQLIAEL